MVLNGTSKDVEIVQDTKTQMLNCCGFGLEVFRMITENDVKELLKITELPGE